MKNVDFQGIGTINGGEYNEIICGGVGKCKGDIKAERMHLEGVFSTTGKIDVKVLECEGTATFTDNIRAGSIDIEGLVTVKNGAKIEADRIDCEGFLTTNGEISADKLHAEGCVHATEIVGDTIEIYSKKDKGTIFNGVNFNIDLDIFGKHKNYKGRYASEVDTIEATTIHLEGVYAENVNGQDIVIGERCEIMNVDCTGTLRIHNTSKVTNIKGVEAVNYD